MKFPPKKRCLSARTHVRPGYSDKRPVAFCDRRSGEGPRNYGGSHLTKGLKTRNAPGKLQRPSQEKGARIAGLHTVGLV